MSDQTVTLPDDEPVLLDEADSDERRPVKKSSGSKVLRLSMLAAALALACGGGYWFISGANKMGRPSAFAQPDQTELVSAGVDVATIEPVAATDAIPQAGTVAPSAPSANVGVAPTANAVPQQLSEEEAQRLKLVAVFASLEELQKSRETTEKALAKHDQQWAELDAKLDSTAKRLDALSAKVDGIEKAVLAHDTAITDSNTAAAIFADRLATIESKQAAAVKLAASGGQERQRLPGFAVLAQVTDGVFSVQAPDRATGEKHYITLYEGESFKSAAGAHRVTGASVDPDGRAILLVDKKFYIDAQREPAKAAPAVKPQAAPARVATASPKADRPNAVQPTGTTAQHLGREPEPASRPEPQAAQPAAAPKGAAQYYDGKIVMTDWRVISPVAEEQSSIVANMADPDRRVETLKVGAWVPWFGVVRSMDPSSGRVCSDKYCIMGIDR